MTHPPRSGYPPEPPTRQAPNNYLVWAILATMFCFPITGILAILKSIQVNELWTQAQYAEAQAAADAAKKWLRWSVIAWIILVIVVAALVVLLFLVAGKSNAAMLAATI